MAHSLYLTHPEVVVDPDSPSSQWPLSPTGRDRISRAIERGTFDQVTKIVCSTEKKTNQVSAMIAKKLGVVCEQDHLCDENERCALGYLSAKDFNLTLDQLYAFPDKSAGGWEPTRATQRRIIKALDIHLQTNNNENVLFVGHGTIGTLLKCYVGQHPIARREDQRLMAAAGGGNIFAFDWAQRELIIDWIALEAWPQH